MPDIFDEVAPADIFDEVAAPREEDRVSPPEVETSAAAALGRSFATGLLPAVGSALGAKALSRAGAVLGPWGSVIGGLTGAVGGGMGTDILQKKALDALAPDFSKELDALQAADKQQHPVTSALGRIASMGAGFSFAPGQVLQGAPALAKILGGKAVTEAERAAAVGTASQIGLQGGLTVGLPAVREGRLPTASELAEAAAGVALYGGPRSFGARPHVPSAPVENRFKPPTVDRVADPLQSEVPIEGISLKPTGEPLPPPVVTDVPVVPDRGQPIVPPQPAPPDVFGSPAVVTVNPANNANSIPDNRQLPTEAVKTPTEAPAPSPETTIPLSEAVAPPVEMVSPPPIQVAPPPLNTTANKNAVIDAERVQRGLPPMLDALRRTDQESFDRAALEIDRNPALPSELIREGIENPRPLRDWEHAVLTRERVVLRNELEKARQEAFKAVESGDPDLSAAAQTRADEWSNRLSELDQAVGKGGAGTEVGRALAIRRRMLNEDFSLASLESQKRAQVGYRQLTPEELAQVKAISEAHKAASDAWEKRQGELEVEAATKAADAAHKALLAEAKPPTDIHPAILSKAEKIVQYLESAADRATERLKAKMSRTGAGIDPTILSDVAIIGTAKLARGVVDFGRWSQAMVSHVGPWIQPHLKEAYDASTKAFDLALGKDEKISKQLRKAIQKPDAYDRIKDASEKINVRQQTGEKTIHGPVKKLVRALVEADPKITRDQLVDWVHEVLKAGNPEITRLEAMDAISGRGKFSLPSQDEVSKTVRDLGEQLRLVGHQQDIVAGKPLPKTGPQRDKISDAARQELRKLNELKREYGVVVTDPAAQLAGALQARKTYYANRIADLRQEIASRERLVERKAVSPSDPELEAMKKEYAQVQEEHQAIFGDPKLTDAQRLKLALDSAKKSEETWTQRLEEAKKGNFDTGKKRPAPVSNPELLAIRARRDALKEAHQELVDLATPKKTPEEIQLQALKTRVKSRIATLQEQTAKNEFGKKEPRPAPKLDEEATRLLFQKEKVEEEWAKAKLTDQLAKRNRAEKVLDTVRNVMNSARDIMTSFDLSGTLRQGGMLTIARPVRGARAFVESIKAMRSPEVQHRIETEIKSRPNYVNGTYKQAKLYLSDHHDVMSRAEEAIRSTWSKKIPGVGASQRAFTTFQNVLRADSFDAMAKSIAGDRPLTSTEGKAIANYINKATGRGDLGLKESGANLFSDVFFAPRYVASRFQLLAGQPLYRGTPQTRLLIAKEYARYLAGIGVIYGLAKWAGGTIELDPRSSDFGKAKFGHTRVDPLSGLQQATVLLSRLGTGSVKTLRGQVKNIYGKVPIGSPTSGTVLAHFLRSKLSPIVGSGVDVLTGTDFNDNPVTPQSAALRFIPLTFGDIYTEMKNEGILPGAAFSLLSILGAGVQNFDEHAPRKK